MASRRFRFRPRVFPLQGPPTVDTLLRAWRDRRDLAVLDSAAEHRARFATGSCARWSLVAVEPLARERSGAEHEAVDIDDVRRLARSLELVPGDPLPGPFHGGFLGALAYDLGVAGEEQRLPRDPWDSPPVVGGLYTDFCVIDHARDRAWLVLGDEPGDDRPAVDERRDSLVAELERAIVASRESPETSAWGTGPLVRHVAASEHISRVEQVREWIAQGELYQANLAHRFTRATRGDPVDLYRRLRHVNPGPYLAYFGWVADGTRAQGALLSASPELLLECEGRTVRTRPIKGTIARGLDGVSDELARDELRASAKDRAELAMIVDLERNDLGRVAQTGSVHVPELASVESYAAVHHLVADVRARLAAGLDGGDALAALFPGGSITGAPKLASMERIAAVEREGRGFFTGAAGFLDTRANARFSVLIRTLVWRSCRAADDLPRRGEVSFHVGGGVTWASEAALEERETLYKGAALAAALSAPGEEPDTLGVELPELEPNPRGPGADARALS